MDLKNIVLNYMFSYWLLIDLVSVIPFEFFQSATSTTNLGYLAMLKCIRIIRITRLFRFFAKLSFGNVGTIVLYMFVLFLIGHIFGNFFYFISERAAERIYSNNSVILWSNGASIHVDNIPDWFPPNRFYRLPKAGWNTTVFVKANSEPAWIDSNRLYGKNLGEKWIMCFYTALTMIVGEKLETETVRKTSRVAIDVFQ